MMRFMILAALASLPPLAAAQAEPAVRVVSELGQSVMAAGQGGKAYLRINLEGLPPPEGGRAPVNVILVLDKSGSMAGERLVQAKDAAMIALDRLGPEDKLGVITYDTAVATLAPMGPLRDEDGLRRAIARMAANGSTALYAGVERGIREMSEFVDPYRVNRVILLSDGMANVGPSSPAELEALGREAGRQGIAVTTIGLGLGFNEDLMTRLALASDGNHAFVERPADLVRIFGEEFGDVLSVIAQDVEIEIECLEGFKPMRTLGREAGVQDRRVTMRLNQLYAKQQKYALIELDVDRATARAGDAAVVKISYTDIKTRQRVTIENRVPIRFSDSAADVEASVNRGVMASVTTQIATERNEEAVRLRDAGRVEDARRLLQENAEALSRSARGQPPAAAAPLEDQARRNREAAGRLDGPAWERERKEMRSFQHRERAQQRY